MWLEVCLPMHRWPSRRRLQPHSYGCLRATACLTSSYLACMCIHQSAGRAATRAPTMNRPPSDTRLLHFPTLKLNKLLRARPRSALLPGPHGFNIRRAHSGNTCLKQRGVPIGASLGRPRQRLARACHVQGSLAPSSSQNGSVPTIGMGCPTALMRTKRPNP